MKICIIKLGADGDVLRTLPIAKAIKTKYPESKITLITKGDIAELLNGISYLDEILKTPYVGTATFDILYNFDIENEATVLAMNIKADKKYGFYSDCGYPAVFNSGAEYYLNTIFDDELKRNNRKTYQKMMFEVAELSYKKEDYEIVLNKEDTKYASNFANRNSLQGSNLIGIHTGASSRWPSKAWHEDKVKEFILKASEKGYKIILFGGPNEIAKHNSIYEELKKKNVNLFRNNPNNTKREFAAVVSLCNLMICSDSFSLHTSIGLKKRTIGLFFCTSPYEVEEYELLKKAISPMLNNFFPERMDEYNEELVNSISADDVLQLIDEFENKNK